MCRVPYSSLQEDALSADSVALASPALAFQSVELQVLVNVPSINVDLFSITLQLLLSHTIPHTPHSNSAESCEEAGVVVLASGCI